MWRCAIPVLLASLVACTPPAVRVIPIPTPEQAFDLDGLRIRAPGAEWYVVDHQPRRIGFVRYGRSWDDSWGAEVQLVVIDFDYRDREDFFARLRARRETFQGDPRYDLLEVESRRQRLGDMECSRSRLSVRDRGALNRGPSLYLLLQVIGLSCLPAGHPRRMIELRFSHRGRRHVEWHELDAAAESFFQGLVTQAGPETSPNGN